ncbi:MAG: lytic transglycosylase domain-containing protein [Mahellales bacterium]|jgi:soluble lytic murein transglycosylase-like protein
MFLSVKAIMEQKIQEIQSRLPIKLNISADKEMDFSSILKEMRREIEQGEQYIPVTVANNMSYNTLPLQGINTENTNINTNTAIDAAIAKASKLYNLDGNLIRSVIKAESNFNPQAVSRAGAMGLMQLMPKTAASLGVTDAFDIEQNILGGSKYLRSMLDTFNNDIQLALAAYNAGPGNVKAYNGVPPFKETKAYINRILGSLEQYNKTDNG